MWVLNVFVAFAVVVIAVVAAAAVAAVVADNIGREAKDSGSIPGARPRFAGWGCCRFVVDWAVVESEDFVAFG